MLIYDLQNRQVLANTDTGEGCTPQMANLEKQLKDIMNHYHDGFYNGSEIHTYVGNVLKKTGLELVGVQTDDPSWDVFMAFNKARVRVAIKIPK